MSKHVRGPIIQDPVDSSLVIQKDSNPYNYIAAVNNLLPFMTDEEKNNTNRLLAAAYTSYDKHCGNKAIECAEQDLLGQLLTEMKRYLPILQKAETTPEIWLLLTAGLEIATTNGYQHVLECINPEKKQNKCQTLTKDSKVVQVDILAFYAEGKPVCSIGIQEKETCSFLETQAFGTQFVCGWAQSRLEREFIENRGAVGFLQPCEKCPIHKKGNLKCNFIE